MLSKLSLVTAFISSYVFASTLIAKADDGGISFGGSPHLLSGHATVAMRSEVVHMNVGAKLIKVDCDFVFHNTGPATTVRMGFPDEGEGAQEPYQGEKYPPPSKLHGSFKTYDSYVDGKKVPTKLIEGSDRGRFWHAKTVTFKVNSDCHIRDVYSLEPGAQVTSDNGMYQQTSYILHTGSSWHGPIGRAEIDVTFAPNVVPPPIRPLAVSSIAEENLDKLDWTKQARGVVVYQGLCTPTIEGQTLKFIKSNFRPNKDNDIQLHYSYRKLTNMPQ